MKIMGKTLVGKRVELPSYYDMHACGAGVGMVTAYRRGKPGLAECVFVRPDLAWKERVKVWKCDWPALRVIEGD